MITVRARPCSSCPYRRDVPSGIWNQAEYDRLPGYDGDVPDQLYAGAAHLFYCHSTPDYLCAGWVGCHDMNNNLAIRMCRQELDAAIWNYLSPIPLFESGAAAAEHGKRHIPAPGTDARRAIAKLDTCETKEMAMDKWWDKPDVLFIAAWTLFMLIAMPLTYLIGGWAILPGCAGIPAVLGFASWCEKRAPR